MKTKRTVFAAAAAVAGTWILPSAAMADPAPPYTFTQCGASTCYVYSCATMPNINDTGYDTSGCQVSYSYPRQREMSGEG
jgi:hypothetical protein